MDITSASLRGETDDKPTCKASNTSTRMRRDHAKNRRCHQQRPSLSPPRLSHFTSATITKTNSERLSVTSATYYSTDICRDCVHYVQRQRCVCVCVCFSNKRLLFSYEVCFISACMYQHIIKSSITSQSTYNLTHISTITASNTEIDTTRMWANAQRDGRPAECRWLPLFNATVSLTPTTRVPCSNTAKTRNALGCPKLTKRSQPLLKFTIL